MKNLSLLLVLFATSLTSVAQFDAINKWLDKGAGSLSRHGKKMDEANLRYINKLKAQELKMLKRLDSASANKRRIEINKKYADLQQTIANTNSNPTEYFPQLDTLASSLKMMKASASVEKIQALHYQLKKTEILSSFFKERQQSLQNIAQQFPLTKEINRYKATAYCYAAEMRTYKDCLQNPDRLLKRTFDILRQHPAFNEYLKKFGCLSALFSLPDDYSTQIGNLQTRSAVLQSITQTQGSTGALQSQLSQSIQSARTELEKLKAQMNSKDELQMPEGFKPNNQKVKRFLDRIEYGSTFQSSRGNYFFPNTTDIGLTIGYKLTDKSTIGIGAGYKIGLGKDYNHIHISAQGLSLRSFVDWKLKNKIFITGGFEYNYQPLADSIPYNPSPWTKSALIGLTKKITVARSKVFKGTNLQLLWDFLSYYQVPRTQPLKFRVGYNL